MQLSPPPGNRAAPAPQARKGSLTGTAGPTAANGGPAARLFIALPCAPAVADALAAWQDELRSRLQRVAWVPPENFHLTLRFLGDIGHERILAVEDAVREAAAAVKPFRLELRGAGSFPRVVWVGAYGDGLSPLAAAVEAACRARGFVGDGRPFRAHLTIGRLRAANDGSTLKASLAAEAARSWGEWQADMLVLMRSRLDPGGAVYMPVLRVPLGRAT